MCISVTASRIRLDYQFHVVPPLLSHPLPLSHCEHRLPQRSLKTKNSIPHSSASVEIKPSRTASPWLRVTLLGVVLSIPSDGAGSCQRLGARIRVTTVHHTSYAALFTKRILVVLAHCDDSPAIREWSRYSATTATAKRRGRERSAMKLDDDAFSFDIMGPPDLDFGTCEYLGSCEYLRVPLYSNKKT